MTKDLIKIPESYFHRYINLVEQSTLTQALEVDGPELFAKHRKELIEIGDKVYAENKWTIKQILQHCIDTERIFQYRALRFARKDATPLPGFDENSFAANIDVQGTSIDALLEEWEIVRLSTIKLFDSMSEEASLFNGTASNFTINALALGFTICGHAIHHINIIRERYL